MSLALGACLHSPAALQAFDAEALAQAMLDYEAALARALADAGELGAAEATAIASVCQVALYDLGAWITAARQAGHPATALVQELRQTVRLYRQEAADAVHRGATDDEVLDTAIALCTARALDTTAGVLAPWLEDDARNAPRITDAPHRAVVRRGLQRLDALRPLALSVRWGAGLAPTPGADNGLPAPWAATVAHRLAGQLGLGPPGDPRLAAEHADRLLLEAALLARELGRGLPDPEARAARQVAAQALEHACRQLAAPEPGLARHEAWCRTFQALLTAAAAVAPPPPG